ncbi:hypothetical protein [Shewanella sp.]|uniref:hypothetical protein n=1 Tax=Shewanella sp. TaxID=50422 RepID=UPI003F38F211
MGIVSTGQFTLVDQNDAKPIMGFISAAGSTQQVYTFSNGAASFLPNWASTPLVLTAKIFVGGVDVSSDGAISGRQWSSTFNGTDLGTGATYSRNTNFTTPDTTASQVIYFRAVYTDPVTGIASRIDMSILLGVVKTGIEAVFVEISGLDVIKQADAATKNVAYIKAVLNRAGTIDGDNLQYRWYSVSSAGVETHLFGTQPNFGVKSTAIVAAPTALPAEVGNGSFTTAGATAAAAWTTAGSPGSNTLVVSENAVTNYQLFKVEIRDSSDSAKIYSSYFTLYDVTDPYLVQVASSAGDRLLNGVGSSALTPQVFKNGGLLGSLTGWTFDWYFFDKNGARAGFVASATPPTPDVERGITANTTGGVTVDAATTLAAGDLVKLVSPAGSVVKFAQVAALAAGTAVVLQTPTGDNVNCGAVSATGLVASEFVGGTLFKAVAKKTTTAGAALTLTGDDVDGKSTVKVDAIRP